MQVKVGSVLHSFFVKRKNGNIEVYDKPIHNYFMTGVFVEENFLRNDSGASASLAAGMNLGLSQFRSSYLLSGIGGNPLVFNTTTKILSNVDIFGGQPTEATRGTYVTSTGEYAFGGGSPTSGGAVTLSNNSFGNISGKRIYHFSHNTSCAVINTNLATVSRTLTISNGVATSVNSQTQTVTAPSPMTVLSLRLSASANLNLNDNTSIASSIFDLDTPLVLDTGDLVGISPNDFVTTMTVNNSAAPHIFDAAGCPISGISASGRFQRIAPLFISSIYSGIAQEHSQATLNDAKIWLIANANKITVPSTIPTTMIEDNVITTVIEQLATTSIGDAPTLSNEYLSTFTTLGSVLTGGLTKQIVAGRTATNVPLAWVIEFDTPQNIIPNKILSFTSSMQIVPDIVIPTYLSN